MNRSIYLNIAALILFSFSTLVIAQPTPNKDFSEIFLDVYINGMPLGSALFLGHKKQLLADADNLKKWRVNLPKNEIPVNYQGHHYYYLHALKGTSYVFEKSDMYIDINTSAKNFQASELSIQNQNLRKIRYPDPGGLINYDISASKYRDYNTINSSLEGAVFNRFGVGDITYLVQHSSLAEHTINAQGHKTDNTKFTRLNTTWTYDKPEKMRTFRLGDTTGVSSMWGRSVAYGGIQFGSNFNTQPTFITTPLVTLEGEAVTPSTVDLYVNNALITQQKAPIGPFVLDNIPMVSGAGQLSVVTTDILGRQQITTMPYYASSSLLKPGLHDYSIEMGFIRKNFTTNSNNYGVPLFTITDRKGLTNHLTSEERIELLKRQQTVGLGGVYVLNTIGQFNTAAAISNSEKGVGELFLFSFQRSAQNFSFVASMQATTPQFMQLGYTLDRLPPSLQSQFAIGYSLHHLGSFGVSFTNQHNREQANTKIISGNYSRSFYNWSVSLSALTDISNNHSKAIYLSLSRPLGDSTFINMNANRQTDIDTYGTIQLSKSLPSDVGYGYNLQLSDGNHVADRAELDWQGSIGDYSLLAAYQNHDMSYQANVSGGIGILNRHAYLSRRINNSFGVVKVDNFPNVDVYSEHQLVARTNNHGEALVPNLTAYDENRVNIDPDEVPFDSVIDAYEDEVIPYYHSGILINFPVRFSRSATLKLVLPSGKPVPQDAIVTQIDDKMNKATVITDGEVYLTGLGEYNKFHVVWNKGSCNFSVAYPKNLGPIPDLGTIKCSKGS